MDNSTSAPNLSTTFSINDTFYETGNAGNWEMWLMAFEILTVIECVGTLWIVLSIAVYGIMNNKWKKSRGGSTLNSGIVYVSCFVSVFVFTVKLAVTEWMFKIQRSPSNSDDFWCNVVGDLNNISHAVVIGAGYTHIWVLQRIIYSHPYVKDKIGGIANFFSRIFVVFNIMSASVFAVFFVLTNSFESTSSGCIRNSNQEGFFHGIGKNLTIAAVLLVIEAYTVALNVYPVVKVKFDAYAATDAAQELKPDRGESSASEPGSTDVIKSRLSLTGSALKGIFSGENYRCVSPIKATVKRTMIVSIIMVVSDLLVLVLAMGFNMTAPYILRQVIYDIGCFVNVVSIVFTFSFAKELLVSPLSVFYFRRTETVERPKETASVSEC